MKTEPLLDHSTYVREATEADLAALEALVKSDEHSLVVPTHVIEKEGVGMIGYLSIGAVPMVIVYMNTKLAKARDSFRAEQYSEGLAKKFGIPVVCVPCAVKSPLHPYMEKLGFHSFGVMDMYIKKV